jgi:hypothetical protein
MKIVEASKHQNVQGLTLAMDSIFYNNITSKPFVLNLFSFAIHQPNTLMFGCYDFLYLLVTALS